MKNKNKLIDINTIKQVVLDIINKQGYTTNLDTKQELRKQNYFVTQSIVRDFMDEIIDNEPDLLDIENVSNNGLMYRKFTLNTVINLQNLSNVNGTLNLLQNPNYKIINNQNNILSNKTNIIYSHTRRDGKIINSIDYPKINDWEVISVDNKNPILYFDGQYTRDEIRNAYACIFNYPIKNTRSRRIKN